MDESQEEIYELRAQVSALCSAVKLAYDYEIMEYDDFVEKYPEVKTKGYLKVLCDMSEGPMYWPNA